MAWPRQRGLKGNRGVERPTCAAARLWTVFSAIHHASWSAHLRARNGAGTARWTFERAASCNLLSGAADRKGRCVCLREGAKLNAEYLLKNKGGAFGRPPMTSDSVKKHCACYGHMVNGSSLYERRNGLWYPKRLHWVFCPDGQRLWRR